MGKNMVAGTGKVGYIVEVLGKGEEGMVEVLGMGEEDMVAV
jgi:hypothetical protein